MRKLIPCAQVNITANPKIEGGVLNYRLTKISMEARVIRNNRMTGGTKTGGNAQVNLIRKNPAS